MIGELIYGLITVIHSDRIALLVAILSERRDTKSSIGVRIGQINSVAKAGVPTPVKLIAQILGVAASLIPGFQQFHRLIQFWQHNHESQVKET